MKKCKITLEFIIPDDNIHINAVVNRIFNCLRSFQLKDILINTTTEEIKDE